jgi:DNA polymerase III delta prime subunit
MGSVAMLTMVDKINLTSHGKEAPVHPFFQTNKSGASTVESIDELESNTCTDTTEPTEPTVPVPNNTEQGIINDEETPEAFPGSQRKRRKLDSEVKDDDQKPSNKKRSKVSLGGNIADHFKRLDQPKTPDATSKSETDERQEDDGEELPKPEVPDPGAPIPMPTISEPSVTTANLKPTEAPTEPPKPKKILLFNPKTGTIGSPPKPKLEKIEKEQEPEPPKKGTQRGRKKQPASRIVKIEYGSDDESRARIAAKIDAILSSPQQKSQLACSTKPDTPKPTMAEAKKPSRGTHPFFLGQSKPTKAPATTSESKPELPKGSPTKRFTSTPCSPKKIRLPAANIKMPQFGTKNTGLKVPGSKLPAWPWKDMVHVRGDDIMVGLQSDEPQLSISSRKSKGYAVKISPGEGIMETITKQMGIPRLANAVRSVNSDEFLPPPPELRLPHKHTESGHKLQDRIRPQLRCFTKAPQSHEKPKDQKIRASGAEKPEHVVAPQLTRLFKLIQSDLSPFDKAQCESVSWAQKYAPVCADEILQPGREAYFLRDWLQALMVLSVDTGSTGDKNKNGGSKTKSAGKKKRKKLDGFIVSSDEEADEMDEVSEEETDWSVSGRGLSKKTVIRAGDLRTMGSKDGPRVANAVVISGPYGCGKTATVYAVARELDFEVFEINPGSRRSGKDVLDKIGDMTRNHIVSHHQASNQEATGDDAEQEDDTAKDIKSGKQSTMASFFKPKTAGAKKIPEKDAKPSTKEKESKKEPSRGQKQSLILLEEVDILYEEDKQFWATVMSLVVQSKRPFIMTCNDEALVPLQNFNLHGIFRLSPPPSDLAVDRLLLIAANEGHALRREAVEALYESRNHDLRAATTDLNFWCQIGVGDRRGGFDWFYPRWPRGIDRDENNRVVRVVSDNTYQPGMNWLGRDMLADHTACPRSSEEELLQQAWTMWNLDIGSWQENSSCSGLLSWANGLCSATSDVVVRLAALEAYDRFAEAMSAADMCSSKSFASFKEVILAIPACS